MTGEGKAASTGMPGKIKVMFQIFPPRAMGHTSSSSPNIPYKLFMKMEKFTGESMGEIVLVGSWEGSSSSL